MTRISFLFLLCFSMVISNDLVAQKIIWQNTIGGNAGDLFTSMDKTSDGGCIVVGYSSSIISFDKTEDGFLGYDYWVVKLDREGNVQWDNTIGGDGSDIPMAIIQTSDGGYFVAGYSNSWTSGDKTEDVKGYTDYWVVKLDQNGVVEWDNTIGGDSVEYLFSAVQTSDNGFLLGGSSSSYISDDKTEPLIGQFDYWIIKLDSIGSIQWQKSIGGSSEDYLLSVAQTADLGYVLGGYSNSEISGNKTEGACSFTQDYWVVKLDSSGEFEWDNTIGGSGNEVLSEIEQLPDGGYIIAGYSNSHISCDKLMNNYGISDFWVVRLNSTGAIVWQNGIGGDGSDEVAGIVQTADNGFLIGGTSNSHGGTGNYLLNEIGNGDYWVVKLDSLGNLIWQQNVGGSNTDMAYDLERSSEGGLMIAGWSNSNRSFDKWEDNHGWICDYWVLKLHTEDNLIAGDLFADLNHNQLFDSADVKLSYKLVQESNNGSFAFSDASGKYNIAVSDTGNFQIMPSQINLYNPAPAYHYASFSSLSQQDTANDFAFQPIGPNNDLCISVSSISAFRSGFKAYYAIDYFNYGTTVLNPDIIFYPDSILQFDSASITPTIVYSDSIVWSLGPLSPFQGGHFILAFDVDTGIPIGTIITSGADILPVAQDINPLCNHSVVELSTTGSLDPNDILVDKHYLFDYQLINPEPLEYLIRFQNIGNDTAFMVNIFNNLPLTLDFASIEILATSHEMQVIYEPTTRIIQFSYSEIMLPQKSINDFASHGYVKYKIKPESSLVPGDTIKNCAEIVFDFNYPVPTGNATTAIILPTGTDAVIDTGDAQSALKVYPNPSGGELNLVIEGMKNERIVVELYNVMGEIIEVLYEGDIKNDEFQLAGDITNISNGIYIVSVRSDKQNAQTRWVKY